MEQGIRCGSPVMMIKNGEKKRAHIILSACIFSIFREEKGREGRTVVTCDTGLPSPNNYCTLAVTTML